MMIMIKNEKLNKLNNNVKKVAKSLREMKKEEKTILSNLEAYKEIKNQLDWAKSLDIHPYMALFLLIKSDYDEFFGRKTSSANVK